jgi:hypothetical protein
MLAQQKNNWSWECAMSKRLDTSPDSHFVGKRIRGRLADATLIVPWQIALPFWMIVGVVAILLDASTYPNPYRVIGAALLIACAAGGAGASIGFLFGMPQAVKANQQDNNDGKSGLVLNTHLQEVADWLTKLLLGVGLAQLANLRGALNSLGTYLNQSTGLESGVAIAIVIYFIAVGFLLGYLWAELYLSTQVARVKRLLESLPGTTGSATQAPTRAIQSMPLDPVQVNAADTASASAAAGGKP